ncbi:MAG: hypothetical protein RBS77_03390 [Candidatus Moranbacteria bacterium]|jgi:hypothetical protein|nr:hypothetical protein [Candidatus Moranbacteria bacterium]
MAKSLFREKEVNSNRKIKEIFRKPEIASVLDNLKERNQMLAEFKKYNKGGITKEEARKIFGKFYYNKNDSLDKKETGRLARAFGIKGAHKYKRPERAIERSGRTGNLLRERFTKEAPNSSNIKPMSSPSRTSYINLRSLH